DRLAAAAALLVVELLARVAVARIGLRADIDPGAAQAKALLVGDRQPSHAGRADRVGVDLRREPGDQRRTGTIGEQARILMSRVLVSAPIAERADVGSGDRAPAAAGAVLEVEHAVLGVELGVLAADRVGPANGLDVGRRPGRVAGD